MDIHFQSSSRSRKGMATIGVVYTDPKTSYGDGTREQCDKVKDTNKGVVVAR